MAHMMAGPVKRVVSDRETFLSQRPLAIPGSGTHFTVRDGGPLGQVTNEDYTGALVQFVNGACGALEACRVINGPQCQMAFEAHGTLGALSWDYERMNELNLFLCAGDSERQGYTRILSGPEHPFHTHFNPGPGNSLSYDDLKTIEAYQFLKSVVEGKPGEPGFREALAVAEVQAAVQRSWQSERWEEVRTI